MQKNLVVFFGGMSCENEVSIITGVMTANILKQIDEIKVIPIYIAQTGIFYTGKNILQIESYKTDAYLKFTEVMLQNGRLWYKKGGHFKQGERIDIGLNCCHGTGGEDGMVSGILHANGIANLSPNQLASSVYLDKKTTKLIASAMQIPTLPYIALYEEDFIKAKEKVFEKVEELGYPVIVKPNSLGSSIGIQVLMDSSKLEEGCMQAFAYDNCILIEKFLVEKKELNCACFRSKRGIVASMCEEPQSKDTILSFDEKYLQSQKECKRIFPANIDANLQREIQSITKKLYKRLDMLGIVRADFIISGDKLFFNEMNTVPGSLAWYLFCTKLEDFKLILLELIEVALERHALKSGKILLRNSGILECLPQSGGIKK